MKSGIENLKQTAVRQATTDVYVVRCRIEQGFRESRLAQSQSRLLFTQLQTLRSPALNAAMGHKATYAVQQEDINKSRLDALNR